MSVPRTPMLAVTGRPPDNPAWAIELQWEGARVLAACDGTTCHLQGGDGSDLTGSYPEVAAAVAAAAHGRVLTLDGVITEIATCAEPFAPPHDSPELPPAVRLCAFDLLSAEEQDLTSWPYLARRHHLEGLGLEHALVSVAPSWRGVEAEAMLAAAAQQHVRGIVSKEIESTYHPGRCSLSWIATSIRNHFAPTQAPVAARV
ncbi:hypothetical protein [Nocardia sp. NPDC050435]|uniref:ATP-dependent DNA ligase n=1 Tax=Nocardia sp. NPDC050435 TaxID=3155040 RepID=UPI0034053395